MNSLLVTLRDVNLHEEIIESERSFESVPDFLLKDTKSSFDWPSVFREELGCVNIMVIYIYIAPGWGQMSPWCHFFFQNH